MKIAPVFSMNSTVKRHDGQVFSSIANRGNLTNQNLSEDVFVRLAEASYKDPNIAAELQAMGLI